MLKKIISIICMIVLLQTIIMPIIANAETIETSKDKVNWSFDTETGVLTISGEGTIKENWEDEIEYNRTEITSIVIEEGIETIDSYSFKGCTNLTSVQIPASVKFIGEAVFLGCTSLAEINVDANNETYRNIGGFLLSKNAKEILCFAPKARGEVINLEEMTRIHNFAFAYCTEITSVEIGSSMNWIGRSVFFGCTGLKTINVDPNNEKYSSRSGVLFNKDETEVICFPAGIDTSITIAIPNTVTRIDEGAFAYANITGIRMPSDLTYIGMEAFYGCTRLTSIEIPDKVKYIRNDAFSKCTNLTTINIPSSVNDIFGNVFLGCTSLEEIRVDTNNEKYCYIDGVLFDKDITEIVCYLPKKELTEYTIPKSVTLIDQGAFAYCNNLKNIEIPETVTEIQKYPFLGCENLEKLVFPNENITIPMKEVFVDCPNLKVWCKSNSTRIIECVNNDKVKLGLDDAKPNIRNIYQKGDYIVIEGANDGSGVGLAKQAYKIDDKYWQENNEIAVTESKEYTVYVRDRLNHILEMKIEVDIDAPEIENVKVKGNKIIITAKDNELAEEAYSIDNENWQASNEITVTESGTYTVYVRDKAGNVATKGNIQVTVSSSTSGNTTSGNTTTGNTTSGNTTTGNTTSGNTTSGNTTTGNTTSGNTTSGNTTSGNTTIGNTTSGNTNNEKPGNEDPKDTDTTEPTITNVKVEKDKEGYKITITATDSGSGLAEEAYSIDNENWQSSNEITVSKDGRYMVYVRDEAGNIAKQLVIVENSENTEKTERPSGGSTPSTTISGKEYKNTASSILPKAGEKSKILLAIAIILAIVGIVLKKKVNKMKF